MNNLCKLLTTSMVVVLLTGCIGEPVEQNEIALVLNVLGDRSAETANNFEADLITATRAPSQVTNPTQVVLKFPLGLQAYEFSERASADSPANEEFRCGAVGGSVSFDVVTHLHIDETLPDIKDRLVALMQAYQLRRYNGDNNVLAELVQDRFKEVLRAPFVDWCAPKQSLSIMRSKAEINSLVLTHMNETFNPYGVRFTLVGVSSAMRIPSDAQKRLNETVSRETKTRVLKLTNTKLKPLEEETAVIVEDGKTEAAAKRNTAKVDAAETLAEAERSARETLVKLLGREAYLRYVTQVKALEALRDSSASITLVPGDARIYLNQTGVHE